MKNWKRLLLLLLACFLLVMPVHGKETKQPSKTPDVTQTEKPKATESPEKESESEEKEEDADASPTEEPKPDRFSVSAPRALLMDLNSGLVLYEKAADQKAYPASTTKIVTAIVFLSKKPDLSEKVTISDTVVKSTPTGSSHMGLSEGEVLTAEQLLYGMLVYSANDAANALAEYSSGSIDAFVEEMNATAKKLGAKHSHFVNPHGFHDDDHYTTTRDLAILARYAMTNEVFGETFRTVVGTETYTIPKTNKYPNERILQNTNLLLSNKRDKRYVYDSTIGIKTGYTSQAGYCLVSAVEQKGQRVMAVITGAGIEDGQTMSYVDSASLYDYMFDHYSKQTIAKAGDSLEEAPISSAFGAKYVLLEAKTDLEVTLPNDYNKDDLTHTVTMNDDHISAPVKKGETLGTIEYFFQGTSLGAIELVANKDYRLNPIMFLINGIIWFITSPWFYIPFLILVIVVIALRRNHQKKVLAARKKKRMEAQVRAEAEREAFRRNDLSRKE